MGAGIAQLCLQAGVPTVALEATPELVQRGCGRLERALGRLTEKGTMSSEQRDEAPREERTRSPNDGAEALGLLEPATAPAALAGCDLVIEAVFESLEVKHEL